jgi:uncharacterized membrane protein
MNDWKTAWTDERSDNAISLVLRTGVIISVAVVIAGAVAYLFRFGGAPADYSVFRGESQNLRRLSLIFIGAIHLQSREMIQLGLVLLMATPIARVAFSVFAFAAQRDRVYVVVTLIVLAILIASVAGHF